MEKPDANLRSIGDEVPIDPTIRAAIERARGILKRKPGEKPFRQWWAEYKNEEKTLEEAKDARLRYR